MAGEFNLDDAAPWGRNRAEYTSFFDLGVLTPDVKILDCAGGPSSFNAEMKDLGFSVVSADPLFGSAKEAIRLRIDETRPVMMAAVHQAASRFVWTDYPRPEALEAVRLSAMKLFLEDFEGGLGEGRYLAASLPKLPFEDDAFDLALCSHFLFTYSRQLDADFHCAAVLELVRVASEVRVFPLLDLEGETSAHVDAVLAAVRDAGHLAVFKRVPYEFQRGGHTMLQVVKGGG